MEGIYHGWDSQPTAASVLLPPGVIRGEYEEKGPGILRWCFCFTAANKQLNLINPLKKSIHKKLVEPGTRGHFRYFDFTGGELWYFL